MRTIIFELFDQMRTFKHLAWRYQLELRKQKHESFSEIMGERADCRRYKMQRDIAMKALTRCQAYMNASLRDMGDITDESD